MYDQSRPGLRAALWLALMLITVIGPALFILGRGPEFPIDDAYIHLQYARNLAQTGRIEFNAGEMRGVGASSLLWLLLLTGGVELGLNPVVWARLLGIMSLMAATGAVFVLAEAIFRTVPGKDAGTVTAKGGGACGMGWAFVTAVLFALSGNMIWFSVTGMETVLFVALGLLVFLCYRQQNWAGVGLFAGLLMICRPEGLAALLVVALLEVVRLRHSSGPWPWRSWLLALTIAATPMLAWSLYLHQTSGLWLPTTFSGKRAFYLEVTRHFLQEAPVLGLYTGLPQVMHMVLWAGYVLMWVFGGGSFPGPALQYHQHLRTELEVRLSLIGLLLAVTVAVPLLVLGTRELARLLRRGNLVEPARLAVLGIWLWALLHNLVYLILLPNLGTGSRYQAVNHLIIWWTIALGLFALRKHGRLLVIAVLCIAALVVVDVGYWRGTYAANLDHMSGVRIAAAEWVAAQVPADAPVAAYDVGALVYFSNHRIIDLGGLADDKFINYQRAGRVTDYLRDRGAQYLVLPTKHSGDPTGLFEVIKELGLDGDAQFTLEPLAYFENDRRIWLRGIEATGNYQPGVQVWRIQWREEPPWGLPGVPGQPPERRLTSGRS